MRKRRVSACLLGLVTAFLLVGVGVSAEPVVVEFFYVGPPLLCETCPEFQEKLADFISRNRTLTTIQQEYGANVSVEWVDFYSSDGADRREQYNFSNSIDFWNSIVINHEYMMFGYIPFNETDLRSVIDSYLTGGPPPPPPPPPSPLTLVAAFTLGFFETFSPCLIALLSFVLSYALGEKTAFRGGMFRVLSFGIGFLAAAIVLGVIVMLALIQLSSLPGIQMTLMWAICAVAIFFGLSLLGVFKLSVETKPIVKRLAAKYAVTYAGLFVLGFTFYFLDPCIAPFVFSMLTVLESSQFALQMTMFSIGAIIPFIIIGLIAGFISKLARSAYKHRSKIRAISGLILIFYAVYLIIFILLPNI